jgi:hypothetical protein
MDSDQERKTLLGFKDLLMQWRRTSPVSDFPYAPPPDRSSLRSEINQAKAVARQIVIEYGCMKLLTISPPPAVGGLIMRDLDPFNLIFSPPYRTDVVPMIVDMLDETVGLIQAGASRLGSSAPIDLKPHIDVEVIKNFAFVAMPMDPNDHQLVDVLDAIKEVARRCGIQAERVDDQLSNDRITDRILESISRAEFVIADLSKTRPNVYFEAGFAHALGKVPIYIATLGTQLEFDLKDYPVIFFRNMRELKEELERRLRAVAGSR